MTDRRAKLRRHVGSRTSSFAKEVASLVAKDPRLRFSVVQVALACTGLANQLQQVAASCKVAQQTFASVLQENADARNHAKELFDGLGMLIMHAADGPLTEAIETLLVVAIKSASSDAEARAMSMQANALGLDTSDIALDEEDLVKRQRTDDAAEASTTSSRSRVSLTSAADTLRIEAVAQVAVTRRLPHLAVEADGGCLELVGYTAMRNRSEHLCSLDCDFAEAQKIVAVVSRLVGRRLR